MTQCINRFFQLYKQPYTESLISNTSYKQRFQEFYAVTNNLYTPCAFLHVQFQNLCKKKEKKAKEKEKTRSIYFNDFS